MADLLNFQLSVGTNAPETVQIYLEALRRAEVATGQTLQQMTASVPGMAQELNQFVREFERLGHLGTGDTGEKLRLLQTAIDRLIVSAREASGITISPQVLRGAGAGLPFGDVFRGQVQQARVGPTQAPQITAATQAIREELRQPTPTVPGGRFAPASGGLEIVRQSAEALKQVSEAASGMPASLRLTVAELREAAVAARQMGDVDLAKKMETQATALSSQSDIVAKSNQVLGQNLRRLDNDFENLKDASEAAAAGVKGAAEAERFYAAEVRRTASSIAGAAESLNRVSSRIATGEAASTELLARTASLRAQAAPPIPFQAPGVTRAYPLPTGDLVAGVQSQIRTVTQGLATTLASQVRDIERELRSTLERAPRGTTAGQVGAAFGPQLEARPVETQVSRLKKELDTVAADLRVAADEAGISEAASKKLFAEARDFANLSGALGKEYDAAVKVMNEALTSGKSVEESSAQMRTVMKALAETIDKARASLAAAASEGGGPAGGLHLGGGGAAGARGTFAEGFLPKGGFAEQIGSVARISLLYGTMYTALFALGGALKSMVTNFGEFQIAVNELSESAGITAQQAEGMAANFADVAAAFGTMSTDAVRVAQQARGVFPGATEGQQAQAVRTASQLALVSGQKATDLGQALAATAASFGAATPAAYQLQADISLYLEALRGIPRGTTIAPAAEVAPLAQESGFSFAELEAVITNAAAATAKTPQQITASLNQIFSRRDLIDLSALGVDPNGSLRDMLAEASTNFSGLSKEMRSSIASQFGRGQSQVVADVILRSFPKILADARRAEAEGPGALERAANARTSPTNIGGQMQLLAANFEQLAINIARSGILDVIGALVFALNQFLNAVNTVLGLFDALPRGVRDVLANLLALAGVARLLRTQFAQNVISSAVGTGSNIAGKVTGAAGAGATAAAAATNAEAAAARSVEAEAALVLARSEGSLAEVIAAATAATEAEIAATAARTEAEALATAAAGGEAAVTAAATAATAEAAAAAAVANAEVLAAKSLEADTALALAEAQGTGAEVVLAMMEAENAHTAAAAALAEAELQTAAAVRAQAAASEAAAAGGAAQGAAGGFSLLGGARALGARAVGVVAANPVAAAAVAVAATVAIMGREIHNAQETIKGAHQSFAKSLGDAGGDAKEMGDAAAGAAQEIKSGGLFANLIGGKDKEGFAQAERFYQNRASEIQNQKVATGRAGPAPDLVGQIALGGFPGLTAALAKFDETGVGAKYAVDSLSEAIAALERGIGVAQTTTAEFALQLGSAYGEAQAGGKFAPVLRTTPEPNQPFGTPGHGFGEPGSGAGAPYTNLPQSLQLPDMTVEVQKQIDQALKDATTKKIKVEDIADFVAKQVVPRIMDPEAWKNATPEMQAAIIQQFKDAIDEIPLTSGKPVDLASLTTKELGTVVSNLASYGEKAMKDGTDMVQQLALQITGIGNKATYTAASMKAAFAKIPKLDPSAFAAGSAGAIGLQTLRSEQQALAEIATRAGTSSAEYVNALQQVTETKAAVSVIIANSTLDALSAVYGDLQSDQLSKAQMQQIAARVVEAASVMDPTGIAKLIASLGEGTRKIVVASMQKAAAAAREAANQAAQDLALLRATDTTGGSAYSGSLGHRLQPETEAEKQQARDAQVLEDKAKQAEAGATAASQANVAAAGLARADVQHAATAKAKEDAAKKEKAAAEADSAASIAAARALADATRSGDKVAIATAQLQQAEANLSEQKRNTVAYYDALGSVYKAQQDLATAIADAASLHRQVGTDLTDQVAVANEAAQTAREKLSSAQSQGLGGTAIDEATLEVRRTQNEAESAAFRRLIDDLKTNEDLKNITHAAYMKGLEAERDRLAAVKVRTRQQTEELNEVQGLINSARDEMNSQFNIGEIKLPTVYEVRRLIAGGISAMVAQTVPTGGTGNLGAGVGLVAKAATPPQVPSTLPAANTVMQDNRMVQLSVIIPGSGDPNQIADKVMAAAKQTQRDPARLFGSRPSRLN